MSFPTDNSVQLPQTSFSSGTPAYDNVNDWSKISGSNLYNTSIIGNIGIGTTNPNGFKMNVLGSLNASILYGDGSNINNLNYDKITLNKPTNFQSDWNSTIINKPNIYTKLEVDTIANTKEAILSFTTPLTRSTNTIGINLSSYSTTGNDTNYLLKSGGTMTGAITNNSTTPSTFNFLNISHASSGRLTHIPFSDNTIYLRAPVKIDFDTLSFGTRSPVDFLIYLYGTDYGFGINNNTLRYNCPLAASHKFYSGATLTTTIENTGRIIATSFSGDGANITNVPYSTITGKPTNFQSDWNSTIINKPVIYTQTETNNLLNAKEAILSFTSPLTRSVNTIGINLGEYPKYTNLLSSNYVPFNALLSSNYATYSGLLSSNYITNATTGLVNYYDKTISDGKYTQCNFTPSYITLNSSNFAKYSGVLSSNYATYAGLLSSNYITNSTSGLTNYSTTGNDPNYIKTSGGTILTGTLNFGSRVQDNLIYLWGTEYGLGVNSGVLRYNCPLAASHKFYSGTTNTATIATGGITALSSVNIVAPVSTDPVSLVFKSTDYNIGIAGQANHYSSSAVANDMIIRSLLNTNLLLQSGGSGYGIKINTANNVSCSGKLGVNNASPNLILDVGSTNANHSIGRAILTAGNIHNADKLDFLSIGRWDGSTTADWQFSGIKYGVITGLASGESFDNHSCMTFHTWGNSISGSREVMRLTSRGYLGIDTPKPIGTLSIGRPDATSDGTLTISKNSGGNRNFKMGYDGSFNFCFGDFGNTTSIATNTWLSTQLTINYFSGNVGIGIANSPFKLSVQGNSYINGSLNVQNTLTITGDSSLSGKLVVGNLANFHNGSPYAVNNNFMSIGSLTLGGTNANYGTSTGWSTNTAAIMLECADYTEMCIHDAGNRVVSCMYYDGPANTINIGRDKGWGASVVNCRGTLCCTLLSVANSGTDYVGVQVDTSQGSSYNYPLSIMYGSFTGFHRCFVDDELFDINDVQAFKDTYIGRLVIATGKIATDTKNNVNSEWEIKYDKEGITIEDTHPVVQLSRTKKDKRIFGVFGLSKRNNSREERMIVNSLGEGGIMVCNSNGNIFNGDYIQSSDYLGYGEKQDDDLLHNYTCAKATISCDFQLDSPYYNCFEIDGGLRVAFIAATYHCG